MPSGHTEDRGAGDTVDEELNLLARLFAASERGPVLREYTAWLNGQGDPRGRLVELEAHPEQWVRQGDGWVPSAGPARRLLKERFGSLQKKYPHSYTPLFSPIPR